MKNQLDNPSKAFHSTLTFYSQMISCERTPYTTALTCSSGAENTADNHKRTAKAGEDVVVAFGTEQLLHDRVQTVEHADSSTHHQQKNQVRSAS